MPSQRADGKRNRSVRPARRALRRHAAIARSLESLRGGGWVRNASDTPGRRKRSLESLRGGGGWSVGLRLLRDAHPLDRVLGGVQHLHRKSPQL